MAVGAYTVALRQDAAVDRRRAAGRCCSSPLRRGVVTTTWPARSSGWPAARLRGPYLAGAHARGRGGRAGVHHARSTTMLQRRPGPVGRASSRRRWRSARLPVEQWQAWIALGRRAGHRVRCWPTWSRSRFGRRLRAVRDDEVAARLAGDQRRPYPGRSPSWSAPPAPGSAAALFAVLTQSVSPGAFPLTLSLFLRDGDRDRRPRAAWPARSGARSCWSRCRT